MPAPNAAGAIKSIIKVANGVMRSARMRWKPSQMADQKPAMKGIGWTGDVPEQQRAAQAVSGLTNSLKTCAALCEVCYKAGCGAYCLKFTDGATGWPWICDKRTCAASAWREAGKFCTTRSK